MHRIGAHKRHTMTWYKFRDRISLNHLLMNYPHRYNLPCVDV